MHTLWLRSFRHRLADAHSLLHMSGLGIISGLSSALVILLFRYAIDSPAPLLLAGHAQENFEALPYWLLFCLPFFGAIIMGFILKHLNPADTQVGIVHVISRLHAHQGHLPLKNALVQFFAGAFAIITGQSGGREGPAIHLGAAANSLLGRQLQLPNNSIRMLVACGTSAAIAASFDTPIAGVIFAMEVIMLEYTVAGFIPVMLATVTATALTHGVYGKELLFSIPSLDITPLWELPYVVMMGLVIGCAASLFIVIMKAAARHADKPIFNRFALAGLITGCCALAVPQVLGLGYDSLNLALANDLSIVILLALATTKLITTSISIGLGLPVGLIGPILLIGACIGSAMGTLGSHFYPQAADHHSFYVLLGMGAMMGAVLNAPLAALMALLELSNNTAVIFPGMLAIAVATLTNSELFKQKSAHQTIMDLQQLSLPTDPVSLALQRVGVASVMQRNFGIIDEQLSPQRVKQLLNEDLAYYILPSDKKFNSNTQNLPLILIERKHLVPALLKQLEQPDCAILFPRQLASHSIPVAMLSVRSTLREAQKFMAKQRVAALYIGPDHELSKGQLSVGIENGIITEADIEACYHRSHHT